MSCGPAFAYPSGAPSSLSCEQAHRIIAQARGNLAGPAPTIDAEKLSERTADWLDPHGLWSVAIDSPVRAVLREKAPLLLAELQANSPDTANGCAMAELVGTELAAWAEKLAAWFEQGLAEGERRGSLTSRDAIWKTMLSTPFEDGPVTRPARDLALQLGREIGLVGAHYHEPLAPIVADARRRFVPKLAPSQWAEVVLAAEVRAYLPLLDVHGAWAPQDEELSIYDLSLEAYPPNRLWTEMARTAVGIRILSGAIPPLENGDIVLRVRETSLAGMSVEQAEQTSLLSDVPGDNVAKVAVLRERLASPITLEVTNDADSAIGELAAPDLKLSFVPYADGVAAVISIPDVPDDLGERMQKALLLVKEEHLVHGVVLDLRGNGGGSTDGAIATLAHFLPGAPLFPMRRRDGGLEVERAPAVPSGGKWSGPIAALVDGDSASAAEMIAGALGSYNRGVIVGTRTYGKGCAQEYLEDEAHAGVLRLTTLVFALPDGTALQKVGLEPQLTLSLARSTETEAHTPQAIDPWRGPDVRDPSMIGGPAWPSHTGRVGPCKDEMICRALRAIGTDKAASRTLRTPAR